MAKQTAKASPPTQRAEDLSGFQPGLWNKEINVQDFIQTNVTPYYGDGSFLAGPTDRTKGIWAKLQALFIEGQRSTVMRYMSRRVAPDSYPGSRTGARSIRIPP